MKKIYKFVEPNIVVYKSNLLGRNFKSDWIEIKENGNIIINPKKLGYAWDGCSPKFNFLDLLFGTPDGALDEHTKPITYYASIIHDAIYQYKNSIPISRHEADKIFKAILKNKKFLWTNVYYFFVRLFGGIYGNWYTKKSKTKNVIIYLKSYKNGEN